MLRNLTILWVLAGCSAGSRERNCEPVRQTGCPSNRICVVATSGVPTCVEPRDQPLAEGDRCDAADACDEGMGCLRVGGVARCLRFCQPSDDPDEQPCVDGIIPPGTHRFSAQARCLAALVDRPDIGACVLPCAPDGVTDCPPGLACSPSLAANMALCAEPGSVQAGEACGVDAPCDAGLACIAAGAEALYCRPFAGAPGCPDGETATPVPGVFDGTTGTEIVVCIPGA